MEALFLKLVNMSITASWLVLAVLVLRVLLKHAPKSIRVFLWGLVGLRLICPFSIESVFSLIPSAEPLPEEFLYAATPQLNSGIPAVNNRVNPIIAQSLAPAELTSANPTQIWSFILAHIWLIGVVLMIFYALVSFLLIRRKVGASIPVGKNLRLCDHIDTPFILGIVRPRIYLPSSLDQRTADHVLAHEQAHLQRRDHWWKPLGFLLLSIYWFNPVMWLAYILLCRDIELACDKKVIRQLCADEKKSYSSALLTCSVPRRMIAACPLAFGEVGVKKRIKSVLNYKKPAFWVVLIAVILCITVAVCFLTDPAGRPLTYLGRDNWDTVEFISIDSADDNHVVVTESEMEYVIGILDDIRISSNEISQSRSEDRDHTHTITLHYEKYDCKYCFSADLTQVWYDNSVKPSLTHEVMNPNQARALFLIASKAPEANRLAVGSYYTAELVYWPLYSSYYWENDPNYRLEPSGTIHPSVSGTMEMEIKEASFCENAVVIGAVIRFPEDLPATNGSQSLSPREVLLYRGGSGTPIKASSVSSHYGVVDDHTADFRFLFDLTENELTETQFLVTIGDFRYAYNGEKVSEDLFSVSWGIPSLGDARTFAVPGDSKDISVSISEIYIEANVCLPDYPTMEDVYQALKFFDAQGNEIPLPAYPNSGSVGGGYVKISICPTEPWGAENVATVMLGDAVLYELEICQ